MTKSVQGKKDEPQKTNQIRPVFVIRKKIGKVEKITPVYNIEMVQRLLQDQAKSVAANAPLLGKRILEIREQIKKALPIAAHVEELGAAMEELAFD